MASFTDSEKVEYALKTTLNITMSKFGYAPFNETPAPPRVFPSNVMSKDLITYGEGDVDANGAYVSGHSQSGNIDTSLTTYESVLKYYKIVCPVTKRVSKAQLSNVLGTTSSQNILGREILDIDLGYSGGGSGSANSGNFWTQPVNSNFHRLSFFRGHYIDENNASDKFNYANTHYKGLNLAWNHIADGTDVSAAIDADGNGTDVTKIVPHLKLFLQVQTAFQIGADNKENQCFAHSMMKNMLGLDFKIPVQVNVGEVSGGDTVNAGSTSDITGPGIASGNEWYTQSTAGTINFYAVGHSGIKVDNSKDPINYPLNSNAPLVTFLKYTGDHAGVGGLGGGGGGGSGSAFEPDMGAVRFKSGEILYDFTEHTFTTGGSTGPTGPQLQTCINAYSSTTWASNGNYFGTNGAGIQKWTIPETATYTITAYGADAKNRSGGRGAIISGDFLLKKGEVIEILVGQRPNPYDGTNGCGAGGTFVVRAPYNTVDSILIIAGGGGGGHGFNLISGDPDIDRHGRPDTKAGSGTSYGTSLNSGNPENLDPNGGRHGEGGGPDPGASGGSGGGGFLTKGAGGSGDANKGGESYINGGDGGIFNSFKSGFGCGGAHGNSHGGGGGGYTGGGGSKGSPHVGGGGGSYNSGTNKVVLWGESAGWLGEGKVDIVKKTTVNYNNFTLNGRPVATGADPLYDFDIHTFTPCKKTGKTGPTFDQCKEEYEPYWVTQSSHFDVTYGIQKWTVPESGTYKITACGAAGGFGGAGSIMRVGGKGALLSGEFDLTKGKVINIAVGQMGQTEPTYYHAPGGGGGGTFITQEPHNTIDSILIVAGGGSGAGQGVYGQNDGESGHGRDAQTNEGYSDGRAGTRSGNWCSSGAGFTANGDGHQGTSPYGYTNNLTSSNVLKGGDSTNHGDESDGGFGGGGFGNLGPGGGGGFCGGNATCSWSSSAEAYGGTSKISDAARNTTFGHDTRDNYNSITGSQPFSDELISEMLNSRPGYVIIEKLIAIADIDGLTSDNGKIGIGTTSPIGKLQVTTTSGNLDAVFSAAPNSDCRLVLQRNHGGDSNLIGGSYNTIGDTYYVDWLIDNNSNNSTIGLKFTSKYKTYPGGVATTNDVMFLHYEGNVGIGTTSPRELLNISGSSSSSTDILYPLMINNQAMHAESNIGGGVGIKFHMYDNGNTEYRYSAIVGISEATFSNKTALGFYTNDNELSAPLERMRIDNEGNVGIGTTSPDYKLDIESNNMRIHNPGVGQVTLRMSNTTCEWSIGVNNGGNGTGSNQCFFHDDTAYRLTIQRGTGNVGIGTTTPQTQLTVKGSDNGGISIIRSSDNYHWRIFNSDSNTLTFQGRNSDNNIRSGCDDLLCLYDSGKIGIGTNSPNEKLEINGWIGRSAHGSGGFCGSYNNIGGNAQKTNPIYVIGSSYKPTDTTFSNMYGVGYCHSYESGTGDDSNWPRCGPYNGWGFYVAADGQPRIFMSAADAGPEICMRGQHPTIYFRDTNHRGCAIHVNSGYFYVLNSNATSDGTTWATQANSAWALQIDLDNNNFYVGGEIKGPYGSDQCRFTGAVGVGGSAVYSLWTNIGHIGESHGYEVLARYNSSKNGDWLYLDSNSGAPSGYHAQTADGSNMYFNVSGNYCAYIRYNGGGAMNFTGQHKAIPKDAKLLKCTRKYVGLIVISSGTINSMVENEDTGIFEMKRKMDGIDINEAIPEVVLSTIYKQKTVYGVISDGEDEEYYNSHKRSTGKNMPDGQRPFQKEFPSQSTSDKTIKEFSWGAWGTVIKCEEDDNRLFVNGVGEGGIWVCDEMGLIENGDYITSSNIPGYGCVQDDDVLHNYTVAKATMDCDFTLSWAGEKEKCQIKRGTWCIDKRRRHPDSSSDEESDCDCIEEDHHFGEHYEPECCAMSHKKDKHGMVYYPDAICHDASGCCEFETCCDCSGNPIMEDYYFEDADYKCKEITHNGKTYRIAFIACTYHCG